MASCSVGPETCAAGSKLGSRVARRRIALTKGAADFTRAVLTRFTDSLMAADAGMRERNRS